MLEQFTGTLWYERVDGGLGVLWIESEQKLHSKAAVRISALFEITPFQYTLNGLASQVSQVSHVSQVNQDWAKWAKLVKSARSAEWAMWTKSEP